MTDLDDIKARHETVLDGGELHGAIAHRDRAALLAMVEERDAHSNKMQREQQRIIEGLEQRIDELEAQVSAMPALIAEHEAICRVREDSRMEVWRDLTVASRNAQAALDAAGVSDDSTVD